MMGVLFVMLVAMSCGTDSKKKGDAVDVLADQRVDVPADDARPLDWKQQDLNPTDESAQDQGLGDGIDSMPGKDIMDDQVVQPRLSAYDCLMSPSCNRILITAHRGDHIRYPESSLAAIRGAAELGADFVELDTRATSDGVVILMHDSSVDGTTDGSGEVDGLTWAQIQELTLKGADPENPETQKVPTFQEALALAEELGLMIYVDQKTGAWQTVVDVVRQGGFEKVALIRDDRQIILDMAPTCSDLLLMPATETIEQVQDLLLVLPGLIIVELSYAEAKPEFVQAVHALGVKVQQDVMATGDVFATLGQTSGWKTFVDAGVDLWQTDLPAKLIPVMEQYNDSGVWPTAVESGS